MNGVAAPLISVIIPTYNHAQYLGRALKSLLDQTYTNWEAIVIDNHSTDNTDEVMASFTDPSIIYLKMHNHGVIAASRNAGIRAAKGEWIAFLDSDDWWKPEKLTKASCYFGEFDFLYHDMYLVKKSTTFIMYSRPLRRNSYEDLLENGNAIINSSAIVRKSSLTNVGYLSENQEIISWEDYECWLRLAKKLCRFKKVKGVLGYCWVGGGNLSNPRRTLNNIHIFLNLFYDELILRNLDATPWWCSYAEAISLKQLGFKADAHKKFIDSFLKTGSLAQKIKIIIRMINNFHL
jgi:glycosyltransferase involved in cell wall biosynthesis